MLTLVDRMVGSLVVISRVSCSKFCLRSKVKRRYFLSGERAVVFGVNFSFAFFRDRVKLVVSSNGSSLSLNSIDTIWVVLSKLLFVMVSFLFSAWGFRHLFPIRILSSRQDPQFVIETEHVLQGALHVLQARFSRRDSFVQEQVPEASTGIGFPRGSRGQLRQPVGKGPEQVRQVGSQVIQLLFDKNSVMGQEH